jgi:hypothetical protein
MRITGSGSVGIGTTNPSINMGNVSIFFPSSVTNRSFSTAAQLFVGDNAGSQSIDKGGRIDLGGYQSSGSQVYTYAGVAGRAQNASGYGGYLSLFTENTSSTLVEAMRIDQSGNVGIGSASPGYRLDVLGAAGSYAGRFVSSDGTASYLIGGNGFANSMQASTTAGSTYTIYASASGGGSIGLYSTASSSAGSGLLASNSAAGYSCWLGTGSYSIQCSGPTSGVSDQRLKKDIRPLEANEGLSAIMQIEPVHYRWKDERMNKAHPGGEIGFIAQNVETVLPLLVSESPQPKDAPIKLDGGKQKALQYDRLAAPIIKAVQELKHMIDGIIGDVKKLAARVDEAFARLAAHDDRLKNLADENKAMRDALCKIDGSAAFCHPAIPRKTSLLQNGRRVHPTANSSFQLSRVLLAQRFRQQDKRMLGCSRRNLCIRA